MAYFLSSAQGFLKGSAAKTFPASLLLIGLEKLIKVEIFSCPCSDLNGLLISFLFIGPAILLFALMYLILRVFEYGCNKCGAANGESHSKMYTVCVTPPAVWLIILLLKGDYVACGLTYWNGVYVFDKELDKSWCKPIEGTRNETVTELRDLTNKNIHRSQISGYIIIFLFSLLVILLISSDCHKSGKCSCCPCTCCKPTPVILRVRHVRVVSVAVGNDAPDNIPSTTAPNKSLSQDDPSPPHEEPISQDAPSPSHEEPISQDAPSPPHEEPISQDAPSPSHEEPSSQDAPSPPCEEFEAFG